METTMLEYNQTPLKGRVRVCLQWLNSSSLRGKVLVDIGCSNGFLLWQLRNKGLKQMIGLDPDSRAVHFAKEHNTQAEIILSKAEKLPLKNGVADIVTLFDVIEHVGRGMEKQVLKEIYRILKKGGILYLSTPNAHPLVTLLDPAWYVGHRHYSQKRLLSLLKECGFKVARYQILGSLWNSVYINWLYIQKWLLRRSNHHNKSLEEKDDQSFNKPGISTIFLVARKK